MTYSAGLLAAGTGVGEPTQTGATQFPRSEVIVDAEKVKQSMTVLVGASKGIQPRGHRNGHGSVDYL